MKQVAILGSTGSIGTQSLDIGSGPGFVARRIIDDLGAEVQCCVVCVRSMGIGNQKGYRPAGVVAPLW